MVGKVWLAVALKASHNYALDVRASSGLVLQHQWPKRARSRNGIAQWPLNCALKIGIWKW